MVEPRPGHEFVVGNPNSAAAFPGGDGGEASPEVAFPIRDLLHGPKNVTFHQSAVQARSMARKQVVEDSLLQGEGRIAGRTTNRRGGAWETPCTWW
jgi:hypothetical protein